MQKIIQNWESLQGNPRQGEPPFTGDGLSQALYRVLVPPTHVFVH
jgi:hypothetical protein